jgi:hypothetical protein
VSAGEAIAEPTFPRTDVRSQASTVPYTARISAWGIALEVPVVDSTGKAVVSPAASTLREQMVVSGQRLLATGG